MAEQRPAAQSHKAMTNDKKRKQPPHNAHRSGESNKKPKFDHRAKQRDARQLSTQTVSGAFKNGELDVDQFVKARKYEIQALEESMNRSKKALNRRAFQQVPKDLRRRTASHNVKKVPKRLRVRAQREMVEDKTPTVTARRRKPTRHMRLRLDIAKRLRAAGVKKKTGKENTRDTPVITRAPRVKKATLAKPPVPKAKFRKRQIKKSWLPTHLFHAKRAHMSPPSKPLWRFSVPLSPTVKSYRPTHRASSERGAVAWDMSYTSTIGLEGRSSSLESVLKGLNVGILHKQEETYVWGKKGAKWRQGLRALDTFAFAREAPNNLIAPVTIIWRTAAMHCDTNNAQSSRRKIFIRVHPSAFFELWDEVLRLAKTARPAVNVEDLRFESGSIEVRGPGGTEALISALWPTMSVTDGDQAIEDDARPSVENTWNSLASLTDTSLLPAGALMGFNVQDPRLHFPPRTVSSPRNANAERTLLATAASWPIDAAQQPPLIFDRKPRISAGASLSSQKAINRRKALAEPGNYPSPTTTDPKIPVLVLKSSARQAPNGIRTQPQSSSWMVLLPWKCVQPVWYSIMYYPLSTGQQPRFGGLDEIRQLSFEAGQPWFPADFPGTRTGWEWELEERQKRHDQWKRHPKGKRTNWDKVDLGSAKPGEIGLGWACDWERLLQTQPSSDRTEEKKSTDKPAQAAEVLSIEKPKDLTSLSTSQAQSLMTTTNEIPARLTHALITVRLSLETRGVPQTCARIYRLPSNDLELRKAWLGLQPHRQKKRTPKSAPLRLPKDAPAHVLQQRLAASLLEVPKVGDDNYPRCPDEADLLGFVTTGNFNLSLGQGTGIGSILLAKVFEDVRKEPEEGRLCIIRNAGNNAGRLARWEIAG